MERSNDILSYWFGSPNTVHNGDIEKETLSRWFTGGSEVDRQIEERFQPDLQRAAAGEYAEWTDAPETMLALIIALDQFSRNIHRGTSQAFAHDDQALEHALDAIDMGHDQQVAPIARVFFYMPLEHAEQLGHQQRCVALMEALIDEAPDGQQDLFEEFADYARQHRDVIDRFGRFPHRNQILGRESTDEELTYLENTDHAFASN